MKTFEQIGIILLIGYFIIHLAGIFLEHLLGYIERAIVSLKPAIRAFGAVGAAWQELLDDLRQAIAKWHRPPR